MRNYTLVYVWNPEVSIGEIGYFEQLRKYQVRCRVYVFMHCLLTGRRVQCVVCVYVFMAMCQCVRAHLCKSVQCVVCVFVSMAMCQCVRVHLCKSVQCVMCVFVSMGLRECVHVRIHVTVP